ncbi:MAG: hypothetical protein HLUCCA11_11850 [Phormidesmis priestleyi Ana]|uniref:Uncharacterized protein n=1 Tax=Phormidesmis priestleyi Ana TaxID=1666911 RepID=A0A0N8KMZ4_9CYAN|nr:MAG: hypothetical protein HLUCCA11_11850 [Phormidesmis priestleyi Ana]
MLSTFEKEGDIGQSVGVVFRNIRTPARMIIHKYFASCLATGSGHQAIATVDAPFFSRDLSNRKFHRPQNHRPYQK